MKNESLKLCFSKKFTFFLCLSRLSIGITKEIKIYTSIKDAELLLEYTIFLNMKNELKKSNLNSFVEVKNEKNEKNDNRSKEINTLPIEINTSDNSNSIIKQINKEIKQNQSSTMLKTSKTNINKSSSKEIITQNEDLLNLNYDIKRRYAKPTTTGPSRSLNNSISNKTKEKPYENNENFHEAESNRHIFIPKYEKTKFFSSKTSESLIEAFIIAGLSYENNKFIPQTEDILSSCGHYLCSKPPATDAEILFRFPLTDSSSLEINKCIASLFFNKGLKLCYVAEEEKTSTLNEENYIETLITNTQGERYYLQSKIVFIKYTKKEFEGRYRLNLKEEFIQIDNLIDKLKEMPSLSYIYEKKLEAKLEVMTEVNFKDHVYVPMTYILISKYPFQKEMKTVLDSLISFSLGSSQYYKNEDFIDYLAYLTKEIPIKSSLEVISSNKNSYILLNCILPCMKTPLILSFSSNSTKTILSNSFFTCLLTEIFTFEVLISLLLIIKLEKKLLFHSAFINNLPIVIESLLNLILPLQWTGTIIPILTLDMFQYTQSFMPFIMGVESSLFQYCTDYLRDNTDVYIVDIDKGGLYLYHNQLQKVDLSRNVPKKEREKLSKTYSQTKTDLGDVFGSAEALNKKLSLLFERSKVIGVPDLGKGFVYKNLILNEEVYKETLLEAIETEEMRRKGLIINNRFVDMFMNYNQFEVNGYEDFISVSIDTDNVPEFDFDEFVKVKKEIFDEEYLKDLTSTQIFSMFIQSSSMIERQGKSVGLLEKKSYTNFDMNNEEGLSKIGVDFRFSHQKYSDDLYLNDEMNKMILMTKSHLYSSIYSNQVNKNSGFICKYYNNSYIDMDFQENNQIFSLFIPPVYMNSHLNSFFKENDINTDLDYSNLKKVKFSDFYLGCLRFYKENSHFSDVSHRFIFEKYPELPSKETIDDYLSSKHVFSFSLPLKNLTPDAHLQIDDLIDLRNKGSFDFSPIRKRNLNNKKKLNYSDIDEKTKKINENLDNQVNLSQETNENQEKIEKKVDFPLESSSNNNISKLIDMFNKKQPANIASSLSIPIIYNKNKAKSINPNEKFTEIIKKVTSSSEVSKEELTYLGTLLQKDEYFRLLPSLIFNKNFIFNNENELNTDSINDLKSIINMYLMKFNEKALYENMSIENSYIIDMIQLTICSMSFFFIPKTKTKKIYLSKLIVKSKVWTEKSFWSMFFEYLFEKKGVKTENLIKKEGEKVIPHLIELNNLDHVYVIIDDLCGKYIKNLKYKEDLLECILINLN